MKMTAYQQILTNVLCFTALSVQAGGSAEASAQAINHSLEAIGYTVESGIKLASGAVAVPLMIVGEIGKASEEIGDDLWEEANSPPHEPFPVTDEVITVGPEPAEQLENRK